MIVGTAGHIDHGKSALVEALTGVHPDRLPEERRRGISLDLGFGHFDLEGVAAGVVDVPGHERFVRTMLAGAAGVDVLLLVVAADAGVQPQTREHFEICRLLGLPRGVIALTKCDLADEARREAVRGQIAGLVAGSFLEQAAVVEVSVRSGAGLAELRRALARAAAGCPPRAEAAPTRLPLDRAFAVAGFGAVATGTLLAGTLRPGEELVLEPGGPRLRVRGLQVHGQPAAVARAGERTAVNLAGIEAAALHRGQLLAEPGVFRPTAELDVALTLLADAPAVAHRARLHLHLHTAECVATLLWLEAPDGGAGRGGEGLAQLRLAQPVVAAPGDRFILRQLSPPRTVGGGRVLDPRPEPHRRAQYAAAAAGLRALAGADAAQALLWQVDRAGPAGVELAELAARLGRRPAAVAAALEGLPAVRAAHPPAVLAAAAMATLEQAMVEALQAFHARQPLLAGAPLDQLAAPGVPAHWRALAIERLRAAGRLEAVPGTALLRLPGRAPTLSPQQRGLRQRLEAYYRQAGLAAPPLPQALAAFPQPATRPLLELLVGAGVLVACQPDWLVHAAALQKLRAELARRKPLQPRFTVPEFKQWTGLSRKSAIPLLEYLDRVRLTRRVGERRELA
ncbi:MAG TPA: selenocysteine-specific translation elongation factor [Terriglobales bacterium]|nr:selenocysteine-specific translation elongation factor [Terriglobales bacterium]